MALLGLFTGTFLFVTLLTANALQMLSLLLWPFSRHAFRRVNRNIAQAWWGMSVLWAEKFHGVKPVFTGDEIPPAENAIVVANHQQMPDIVALMMLGWRKKRLGDMKWFVKDSLKFVPGMGWGLLFLDCVFLKRSWDKDENRIRQTFAKFRQNQIPLWLMSFPEGTRFTPAKLVKARAFAQSRGGHLPQRVLVPRSRGFAASVMGLRDHVQAVYDVTIAYQPGRLNSMWGLFQTVKDRVHLHVRRYPVSELPSSPEDLGLWLAKRFAEKDELLDNFAKSGVLAANVTPSSSS